MARIIVWTEQAFRNKGYIDEMPRTYIPIHELVKVLNSAAEPGPDREYIVTCPPQFPFRHGDCIQHVSGQGDIFIVRTVDDVAYEAYAENLTGPHGTRVLNPGNWKKVPRPA